jgi:hypothetical protein
MKRSQTLLCATALGLIAFIQFNSSIIAQEVGFLARGDAIVTGFSGVVEPMEEPPEGQEVLDETFINPEGISARVSPLAAPGYLWDGRVWPVQDYIEFRAKDIGQVFGVTLDDETFPNIYLTATSAYGLQIVEPDADNDGRPERLKKGKAEASWMAAQWGTTDAEDPPGSVGGPGSIWKVDGKTGNISLFANVAFQGAANGGAGLGNITYSSALKQLFVSDLSTGMIHRFDLQGQELEVWDAGVQGMSDAGQSPVPYDPAGQLDITSRDFDSQDPDTWGMTDENRRVYGLTFHEGRLYYALFGPSQIWSVGLDEKTGAFLRDARWELDVPKKPKKLPVTDMLFGSQGAMILAQRGSIESTYDYANFADPGKARLYRYWKEDPDDSRTPSIWFSPEEEYAIGFEPENRSTDGGIALNHGYKSEGLIDPQVCEASIWTTADNLRRNEELTEYLLPGGPLMIDGLQGAPTGPVKDYAPDRNNAPPWSSYMLDIDQRNTDQSPNTDDPIAFSDTTTQGWMGDVAILRDCNGALAAKTGGGKKAPGYYGWPKEWPFYTSYTEYGLTETPVEHCIIGVSCPPPKPKSCAKPEGKFFCDSQTGTLSYVFDPGLVSGFNANMIKVSTTSPGVSIPNGPMVPLSTSSILEIKGAWKGQLVSIPMCIFDKAAMDSGKAYDCCKTTLTLQAPACVKK